MIQKKAEKLYLGNITTMEDVKPFAKALTVIGDKIQYVGSEETARALCDENTEVFDFGDKYIYPGFLDSHTHGLFAGYRFEGQGDVSQIKPPTEEGYKAAIKDFIDKHPNKEIYMAAGWIEDGITEFTSEFLDEICPDKPLVLNSAGAHSILLNHAAMKYFEITKEYAKEMGPDLIKVDENGEPTGYLCEGPAVKIASALPISVEEAKEYLLAWQAFAFSNGYTGASDAGVEIVTPSALEAYVELEKENKLKFYTYGYMIVADNDENPKECAAKTAKKAEQFNSQHFNIVGSKVFLDGVLEAHTAWLLEEYDDQPGYFGNRRFDNPELMTQLIAESSKYGHAVHAHSDGDAATKFFLDCVEAAQKQTGDMDQRNALAHLQFVRSEDIKRMADTNSIAIVPPLWTPGLKVVYEGEKASVGEERAAAQYPIKSFIDAGADVVFHSDFPISPAINAPMSVYTAVLRNMPDEYLASFGGGVQRGENEVITRKEALLALTKNVAYMWHQEDVLGSLACGKIANLSILDTDLLNDELDKVLTANIVATVVDGEIVYQA